MKKILAIICAIALICSLAAVVSADETTIYSEPVTVGSGWQTMTQINTTLWGGTFDTAVIVEGGQLEINLSCAEGLWSAHVVLQGTGSANGWQQIDKTVETMTVNTDGSYTVVVTYSELVTAYGGSDFSDMGALYVYSNSDTGAQVTLNKVSYVVASTEESTEATTEATEATTEATESTTATEGTTATEATTAATEETEVKYVEVVKETVLATDLPSAAGWNQTEIYTTVWGGELDPSVIVKGGCLKLYVTATPGDLWQVRLALNGTKWVEMDWHVDEASHTYGTITDNGDGTYVVTFTYDELVAAYGADDFATTLGAIYPITNAASAANITKITYEHTELVPDTSNAKTGDSISVFVALLAVSAMGIAVIGKKKEF